ncbi:MAG: S8 family serine peptidase [Candidatus Edwardsbacteria bacterium]|nr:S8 family serine peptidase [Candidatus Edwardsbacteria bacterium]
MNKLVVLASALIALSAVNSPARDTKISRQLQHKMDLSGVSDIHLCWVLFADKDLSKSFPSLEAPAAKRRAKIGRELSYGDLPVSSEYLDRVRRSGAEIRVISPWLNAVSIKATAGQLSHIAGLKGVKSLEEVAVYKRPLKIEELPVLQSKEAPSLDYGSSLDQIKMMKVDQLHQKGYSGSGVRLTIIDTGFDRWHESLLRTRVIAERDFQRILAGGEPDTITSFEPLQDSSYSQTWHGTGMLSIAGGYKSGQLIGSAYNADFILAKTEMISGDDFYQEEDWWIAALQWASDSIGTDIVSSSLGYRYWSDSSQYNYGYDQMDGDQARCSRAADSAASRGVLILNALGNIRNNSRPDTSLVAPADADSIIAVGGAWASTGDWSTGAVTGPPADSLRILPAGRSDSAAIRRIKPDIASCWQNYYAYNEPDGEGDFNRYASSVGTSGATALTAGLCALLLEAHPSWGPQDVIKALKYSGSNRSTVEAFFTVPESLDITLGSDPAYNPGFADIATGHKYYTSGGVVYDLYDVYRIGWGVPDGIKALNYTSPEVVLAEEDQLRILIPTR